MLEKNRGEKKKRRRRESKDREKRIESASVEEMECRECERSNQV